ncbi:MAG: beta galactosidase jelly roll domain-containing protein, partial [Prevotellaceae bacterium]|nr:beta galactosidase jelly roll domain-containing protein [Prevotellaceae bacterium]
MKHFFATIAVAFFLAPCSARENFRKTLDFTESWQFTLADSAESYAFDASNNSTWKTINLPHDWSIEADFSLDNPATPGGGALPGGIGWYRKTFEIDKKLKDKKIFIDFDGIYQNSEVWMNGESLGKRPNGYVSFRYDLTPYIQFGKKNVITIKVDNSHQPNSRWYSGSGIYRNVRLTIVNPLHVDHWGAYVTTPEVTKENATVQIITTIRNTSATRQQAKLFTSLIDASGKEIARTENSIEIIANGTVEATQSLQVNNPALWSVESPYLYKIITRIEQNGKTTDEYETP